MNLNVGYMKNLAALASATKTGWFKIWFDSSFYHHLYGNRNEQEAALFVDGLVEKLKPQPNARILDLGCGAGRHSKYLAFKGFRVTGIDLAASSILEAQRFETESLQFYQHDMRVAFGNRYFDYVFNFFTSFGYFETDAENEVVIRNIANSLKPGGIAMIDYLNVAYAEQRLVREETKMLDGIEYQISRWMDDDHFFKKITIVKGEGVVPMEYIEKVAKLRLKDFEHMVFKNKLSVKEVYGNYELDRYDADGSPRMILIIGK